MYTDKPVTTQAELDAAITAGDYPVIEDNGRYEIPRDIHDGHTIRVKGTAKPTVVAYDSSSPTVEAYGSSSPTVVAYDSSSPTVVAYDSSSPTVEASDSSSPTVEAYGTSSPTVVAYGTSSPTVVAYDSSSPTVVAYGTSSPTVEAYGTSSPTVVAYGSSSPTVVAYGTSSPTVEAYGTSSPTVEAYGTSSPTVVASDSSSPTVVASDSSSPTVEASAYASIVARGAVTITADNTATVRAAGSEPQVTGGALVQRMPLTTNAPLARQILTQIEQHPDTWNQGSWAMRTDCGTAYCFAGHAVALSGGRMNIEDSTVESASLPEAVGRRFLREHVRISEAAQALLGLDSRTADRLFSGNNDLDDLRDLVDEICAGAEPQSEPVASAAE